MTRYRFVEVRSALREHWGLALYRGGEMGDGEHDGRWDVTYSRTGFVVYGDLPGRGHGGVRYETLAQVVTSCGLTEVIGRAHRPRSQVSHGLPTRSFRRRGDGSVE